MNIRDFKHGIVFGYAIEQDQQNMGKFGKTIQAISEPYHNAARFFGDRISSQWEVVPNSSVMRPLDLNIFYRTPEEARFTLPEKDFSWLKISMGTNLDDSHLLLGAVNTATEKLYERRDPKIGPQIILEYTDRVILDDFAGMPWSERSKILNTKETEVYKVPYQ